MTSLGEQRWTLGGFGYHHPSPQVPAGSESDLTLMDRAFGELLQNLHGRLDALRRDRRSGR